MHNDVHQPKTIFAKIQQLALIFAFTILGLAAIMVFGIGSIGSDAVDTVTENALEAAEVAVDEDIQKSRQRAASSEGWGYSDQELDAEASAYYHDEPAAADSAWYEE